MDEEEIKSFLERTDDLGTRLTGEDKETFAWVVYGYNQCAKLLKEIEEKAEELQKDYLEALIVKHERAYEIAKMKEQQEEFIKYLEDEKDRLATECSNIYEDSLGHTRLVNADKFDEANEILQKYKEIIGVLENDNHR